MNKGLPPAPQLPTIEHAIQFVGPGRAGPQPRQDRAGARPDPAPRPGRGGRDLLLRHEAAQGLLDAPPEGDACRAGSIEATLGGDPELRAGRAAHGPRPRGGGTHRRRRRGGHAARRRRARPRADRLPAPATPGSNAAFGYNFEGGLQEYVLLDERMIIEPATGRTLPDPGRRGTERLGGRAARALGLRRGVVRVAGAGRAGARGAPARRGRRGAPGRGARRARGRGQAYLGDGGRSGTPPSARSSTRPLAARSRRSPRLPTRPRCRPNPSTTSSTSARTRIASSSSRGCSRPAA